MTPGRGPILNGARGAMKVPRKPINNDIKRARATQSDFYIRGKDIYF